MLEKRSIGTCILLTFVTCGIYGIYWFYCILRDLYTVNNMVSNAGTDVLLSVVTCNIYGIYTYFQMGNKISSARYQLGLPPKDDSTLFVILGVIGTIFFPVLIFIIYAIVQSDLNDNIIPAYYNMQVQYVMKDSPTPPSF